MLINHTLIASVNFAINLLKHELAEPHFRIKKDYDLITEMRQYLPYTLLETTTSGKYILLNRQYQLLGSTDDSSIPIAKYGDYTDAHIELTSAQVDSLCSKSNGLYSDSDAPWIGRKQAKAYLIRLQDLHDILINNDRKIRQ